MKNIHKNKYKRIDKTKILVSSLGNEPSDKSYWLSLSPEKRFHHIEMLRFLNYGDKAASRLQRFFEVTDLIKNKQASGRLKDLADIEELK